MINTITNTSTISEKKKKKKARPKITIGPGMPEGQSTPVYSFISTQHENERL